MTRSEQYKQIEHLT